MDILQLLIPLLSGAAGGNIIGSLVRNLSLGTAGNSIAGVLGGGIGQWLLTALGAGGVAAAAQAPGLDVTSILSGVLSGGAGGGALMAIIGVVRNMMNRT